MKTVFKTLPIEWLVAGRYQPRTSFPQDALQELAQSIASQGLIEPLVVREIAFESYEIIAGERRWRAAMQVGLSELPCLIGTYSDEQAATLTLVENIQRQDLNLIEEANGYQRLFKEFHFQQEEIAALVGKSRSHIANLLRLLTLCDAVQQCLRTGALSLGHGRMLVGLPRDEQLFLLSQIEEKNWSVRQLESKVREMKNNEWTLPSPQKDRDIERLEIKLAEQIGSPVQIISEKGTGGWLQVKFFDNDTLAGLLERMGLSYD